MILFIINLSTVGSENYDPVKELCLISIRFLGKAMTQHYKHYKHEVGICLINYFILFGFCFLFVISCYFSPTVSLIQNMKSSDVESFHIMTVF